jgi:hypothetical protein
MTQGIRLAWEPFAAAERAPTGEVPPKATCHAQLEPRRRAVCGYKLKDLGPIDARWDELPIDQRCPTCHSMVGPLESRAAQAMAAKIRSRLEVIDGLLRTLDEPGLVDDVLHMAQDVETIGAGVTQPPRGLTVVQARYLLDLRRWPLPEAARRLLEKEREELFADLAAGSARVPRPGRIDMGRALLLIVSEEWATATKRRRDQDTQAMLPIEDEPGPEDDTNLRRALDFHADDLDRLRYHQFCVVAPADHPIRTWALRFFDTHLPDLVAARAVFTCEPLYDPALAEVYAPAAANQGQRAREHPER